MTEPAAHQPEGTTRHFKRSPVSAAVSLLSLAGLCPAAHAQDASSAEVQKLEKLVITGTLIRGVTPAGSPVVGYSAKEIKEGGYFTATDVLRSLPQILNLGATDSNTITTASSPLTNQTGANGINLRGLGTPSTLTLINGHRSATGGGSVQIFDASTIPSLAISRLDVLVDGASTLYGSDAVAGVVNVHLKKGIDGATTQLSVGGGGGVRKWSFSQLLGKTWGTGSLTATVEHTFRNNVFASERPDLYDSNPFAYGITPANTFAGFSSNPANIRVSSGTYGGVTCSAAVTCYFGIPNQNGSGLTPAALPATPAVAANRFAGANVRNLYDNYSILPEQKRDSLVLVGDQELTERVKLNGELVASKRDFSRYAPAATANLSIPRTNPNSPCFASRTGICAGTGTLVVPYDFGQYLGPGINKGYSKYLEFTVGLEVDLGHDWRSELTGTYSKNVDNRLALNSLNTFATNTAGPGYTGPTAGAGASGYFLNAFNPFIGDGSFNAVNQGLVDNDRAFNQINTNYNIKNFAARFDGPLFRLRGGEVKLAVGAEHRLDAYTRKQQGTALTFSGQVNQAGVLLGRSLNAQDLQTVNLPTRTRKIDSAYAEFFVPVIGKTDTIPFVQRLDLSLAGRVENNDAYGSSRIPKTGFTWAVNDDFQFNGTWGRSYSSPSLVQIDGYQANASGYSGQTVFYPQSAFTNFDGSALTTSQTVIAVGGGNPNLKPETARTATLGFSFHPRAVRGLDVTVSYYDIKYTNRITTTSVFNGRADVLTNPIFSSLVLAGGPTQSLGTVASPSPAAQQWIDYIRQNTIGFDGGEITGAAAPNTNIVAVVDARLQNAGILTTNGVDITGRYAWNTAVGRFNTILSATFVNSWKTALITGTPLVDRVNTNSDAYPLRFRGRGQFGWNSGPYGLIGFVNYSKSYTNNNALGTTAQSLPAAERVASYTTMDLNLSYDFGSNEPGLLQNMRVQFNVQNLFDRSPPNVRFLTGSYTKFDPQNASALGRQFSLQVSKDW